MALGLAEAIILVEDPLGDGKRNGTSSAGHNLLRDTTLCVAKRHQFGRNTNKTAVCVLLIDPIPQEVNKFNWSDS